MFKTVTIASIALFLCFSASFGQPPSDKAAILKPLPFSTSQTHITVWNGEIYVPLFIKGINLGVAVPGTFPAELAATREDYALWFQMIRETGFNSIRVYTLHYPRFYEELRAYNLAHPNHPLYVFHGIWLEEEIDGYDEDLYSLTSHFELETRENVRAVHGDISIGLRQGKAYGAYTADISPWVIGYIMGREIHPPEVLHTNATHASVTSFEGEYLAIENTNASEAWLLGRMDYLLRFEMDEYDTQRPVSVSSWPTLDPLSHPDEQNKYETSASLNFKDVDFNKAQAGFFVSYHAYPYYPNYISRDPRYTGFFDHLGPNSYLGYLTALKAHYTRFPLIIAEYGASSSWGVAQYAQNGIHHGGYSEREQGQHNVRMLKNIDQAGAGGGIQFAWIDEWFKRTWITDPLDFDIDRRIIWHNVTAAEQNFGLIGYRKPAGNSSVVDEFCSACKVQAVLAVADFAYLTLEIKTAGHIGESDTVWVGLDTYDAELGESVLPNGQGVTNRIEFALMITNYKAELYVTRAYDTYGNWHGVAEPYQVFHSTATDGGPWRLVRWKNDVNAEDAQNIGSLKVNRLNMPPSSTDGVRLKENSISIRLPWSLLHFTDPSQRRVLHDDRATPATETRLSDGIGIAISYRNTLRETSRRYLWEPWNHALNTELYRKASYYIMQEALPLLPGNPIAVADHYEVDTGSKLEISLQEGVLSNDLSLDGVAMQAVLVQSPQWGLVQLQPDGSFTYQADQGYTGADRFTYRTRAGANWSEPVGVTLTLEGIPAGKGFVGLYPNPSTGIFTITSQSVIDNVRIYSVMGKLIHEQAVNALTAQVNLSGLRAGVYFASVYSGGESQVKKFIVAR